MGSRGRGGWEYGEKKKKGDGPERMESDHIWRRPGKTKINLAYFTVLPRAGLGAFISTTQGDILGDMF